MKIVLVLGYSGAGKTTAIGSMTKALTKSGKKVGTLKHISDPNFTIDTKGKDTWRHANAGAAIVVALSAKELTIIKKGDMRRTTFDEIVSMFQGAKVDYLLVEGMYMKLRERKDTVRVLCARNKEEAKDLMSRHPTPACVLTGPGRGDFQEEFGGVPVLSVPRDTRKVLALIG